ncbi:MAG: ATP synthase F1 subunit epsilon [Candidatus Lindowbacteria bacterium]|nr:ATP synthase F1 subunit epsilon [Candidatus Lindowbacteria bacterium]
MSDEISYEILTPYGSVGTGTCEMIVAPAVQGEVGILKNHAPYLSALDVGVLRVKTNEGTKSIFINGGFIEVLNDKVVVLAETSEASDEIDVDRAKKSIERASKRLEVGAVAADKDEPINRTRARRSLIRAKSRLKAAGQLQ